MLATLVAILLINTPSNIHSGPEIGKGQFSTVYAGKYFGDLVAVKKQIRKQVVRFFFLLL